MRGYIYITWKSGVVELVHWSVADKWAENPFLSKMIVKAEWL